MNYDRFRIIIYIAEGGFCKVNREDSYISRVNTNNKNIVRIKL
jgi:hypothetical protein